MSNNSGKYLPLMQQAGPVIRGLRLTSNAAQIGAAATSTMIVGVVAYAKWLEVLPPTWAKVATAAVIVLFLFVVEAGLRTFAPFTLDELFSFRLIKEDSNAKKAYRLLFVLVCLGLIVGLACGSMSTSWIGRMDMAEVATPPPQVADLASITARQETMINRMDSTYEAKLAHLRNTEDKRLTDAKQEAARLMANAERSKGQRMYELYKQGNGWAAEQLSAALAQARKEGEALLKKEREAVQFMELEKRRYMAVQNTELRDRYESVEAQNEQKLGTWESKYQRNSALIGYFGVGCTALFFLCQVLLSLARIVSDVPTFQDETGADARAGSKSRQGYSLLEDLRSAREMLRRPSPTPAAAGPRPVGFETQAHRQATGNNSTGNISGNNSGNNWANSSGFSGSEKNPPNNMGKKYRSNAQAERNREAIHTAYQALLAEHNAPPTAVQVAEVVGLNEKTVRTHLRELRHFY